jgi:hypothetical protein
MSNIISVDLNVIFSYAGQIVTIMMPIVGISAGFGLGFGLINKIGSLFSRAL